MSTLPRLPRRGILSFVLLAGAVSTAQAQLISPKTVPVKQGEQFGIYPSQWPGMGGVSIALEDTLGDPWANPAKAARLTSGWLQVMPFTHHATEGGGRSLPISILQTSGSFAGGALFSMQELERRNAAWNAPISDRRASNEYFTGLVARRLGGGFAIGAGLTAAELHGIDGVTALYFGSDRVRQAGGLLDARLGLTKELANGATLEMVGVHNRFRMTHDVHFPQRWQWAPCPCPAQGPCTCNPVTVPARDEHHKDQTNVSGLHAVFLAPKTPGGWRMGYLFTANRLSHPKLPDYRLPTVESIPRDPGNTTAFNVGFGTARTMGNSTFGFDIIKEPMWSHTWADAAGDTVDVNGRVIRQGQHTVDNHFRFSNSRMNVGVAYEAKGANDSSSVFGWQFGLAWRTINYTLDQENHVTRISRSQDEGWTEWTPTLALRLRGRDMSVTYAWSVTCGPQCMDFNIMGGDDDVTLASPTPASGPTVLAPPEGPLTFGGGSSGQHRLMISIRLR